MKILFYLIIFFIFTNCATNKDVHWCGDHPCIDNKERKAYFKKTMIVEIKEFKKETKQLNSETEKIIQHARLEEKRKIKDQKYLAKQAKLEKKRKIKEQKYLVKQVKLEEKRRIKEQKYLVKQAKLEEKKVIKEEKYLSKQIENDEKKIIKKEKKALRQTADIKASSENITNESTSFRKLVEKIIKKNSFRSYRNINDIPN